MAAKGPSINMIDFIDTMPEIEQREMYKHLAVKYRPRSSGKVPREQKVVLCGKILTILQGMSLAEMKAVLTFTTATVDSAVARWKNPKRDNGGK